MRGKSLLARLIAVTLALSFWPGVQAQAKPTKTFSFSLASYEVTEGDGGSFETDAAITIDRSISKGKASVAFSTIDDTASEADGDYAGVSTTVTFTHGQTSKTVLVPVFIDGIPGESDETVDLTLSSLSHGWTVVGTNPATLTIHEEPVPDTPTNLSAVAQSSSEIDLNWDPVTSADVASYAVLRGTTSGGPYEYIDTAFTNSYNDMSLDPDTTYYYVVEAQNSDNGLSADSNEASDTTLPAT